MTVVKLFSSPMFSAWRWYAIRESSLATARRTSGRRRQGRPTDPAEPGEHRDRGAGVKEHDQVAADGVAGSVPARRHGGDLDAGRPERHEEHHGTTEPVRRDEHQSAHDG